MKQYENRDPFELGEYYHRHADAMTAEGLHEKADIAAELAYRDKRIDELLQALFNSKNEAFKGNIEAVNKLGLDVMDLQPILTAVQDWSISTGKAREMIRCFILGTFEVSHLPIPQHPLNIADNEDPAELFCHMQNQLHVLRNRIADQAKETV